jgi:hypothetical protein
MQIILVTRTLEDHWPLGDIAFGVFFFAIGQVILYAFSTQICNAVQHYLDGLFFATICNLLAVMMVYKVSQHILVSLKIFNTNFGQYWDSITKEDLEFSVGTKQNTWEVKELLPEDERRSVSSATTRDDFDLLRPQRILKLLFSFFEAVNIKENIVCIGLD